MNDVGERKRHALATVVFDAACITVWAYRIDLQFLNGTLTSPYY